jgi:hypothetical protein
MHEPQTGWVRRFVGVHHVSSQTPGRNLGPDLNMVSPYKSRSDDWRDATRIYRLTLPESQEATTSRMLGTILEGQDQLVYQEVKVSEVPGGARHVTSLSKRSPYLQV